MAQLDKITACYQYLLQVTEGDPLKNYEVNEGLGEDDRRKFFAGFVFQTAARIIDEFGEGHPIVGTLFQFLMEAENIYTAETPFDEFLVAICELNYRLCSEAKKDLPCCNPERLQYYLTTFEIMDKYLGREPMEFQGC